MRTTLLALATAAQITHTLSAPQSTTPTYTTPTIIPLGGICDPSTSTCALGSQCYATTSLQQPRCGNFQAACTSSEQCAFNSCNIPQGFCNGGLSSTATGSGSMSLSMSASITGTTTISSTLTVTATTVVTAARNGTGVGRPTGGVGTTGFARPTSSVLPYTGSASVATVGSGLLAAVFGVVACVL